MNALTFSTTCCSRGRLLQVLYHRTIAQFQSAWSLGDLASVFILLYFECKCSNGRAEVEVNGSLAT